MRNRKILLMMLLASVSLVFSSCKSDDTENETKQITLAVSGNNGELIVVDGTDVIKDVTITATENVDRDVMVTLTTDGADGSAVLAATSATIAKGTKSATVKITFPASKFPEGTDEKAIKVTASTTAEMVDFSPAFTTFNVKGEGGQTAPSDLAALAGPLTINTTAAAGVAEVNFTLTKPVDEDITIAYAFGDPSDFVGTDGVVLNPSPIVIAKGQGTLKLTITVPQGRTGSMPITFTCENPKVMMEPQTITFQFVTDQTAKPIASLVLASGEAAAVSVDGADVIRNMEISLNKAPDKEVTITLAVQSSNTLTGTLSTATVKFLASETGTKDVNITFKGTDFVKNTAADVTVTITSEDVDIAQAASSIKFVVTGPADAPQQGQDGKLSYEMSRDDGNYVPLNGDVIFTDEEKTQGYIDVLIYSEITNSALSKFDPAVHDYDFTVTGTLSKSDFELDRSEGYFALVYDDSDYGYAYMKIKSSAIGKSGTFTFTSGGTTFAADQTVTLNIK